MRGNDSWGPVFETALVGGAATGLAGQTTADDSRDVLVGLGADSGMSTARTRAQEVRHEMDFGSIGKVVAGRFSERAIRALERNSNVRYVEEDGTVQAFAETLPWGIDRVDADVAHANGETGDGADIAIIDTGIDEDHPDLQANLGTGRDFTGTGSWDDDNGHGTHCGGTADAVDNTEGVIGVSTEATLHAAKVLDSDGSGTFSDVAAGIEWVANQGYDVGSLSLGASSGTSTLQDACQYAQNEGVLLVAAAGNDYGGSVSYPAAYSSVMAVSSTDRNDNLSSFSNVGPEIEIAAPGSDVYSTYNDGGYTSLSGTSMACPHVSGAAGQLMANGKSNSEARQRLKDTAEDIGLSSEEQGAGLLDVENAIPLQESWTFDAGSRLQYASPAADASRVYVGGLDRTLWALDRSDGSRVWSIERAGALADSSPTLSGGRLYVGSGGGELYALDAATGSSAWTVTTDSAIVSSPTVDGDTVYVGTNDGRVFALDDTSLGAELWRADVGGSVFSTPAVDVDSVYVTTRDGTLVALDSSNAQERWRFDAPTEVGHASPLIADGSVYFAADDVYALDPSNGSVTWRQSYGGTAGSSPAHDATNGRVVVGDANGTVHALNTDGTVAWTHDTGGTICGTPTVANGRVVVGSDDGDVSLLDAADGSELTRRAAGTVRAAPTVDDDVAFVGTWSGTVVALANAT